MTCGGVVGTVERTRPVLRTVFLPELLADGPVWLASISRVDHIGSTSLGFIGGVRVAEGEGFGETKLEAVNAALTDYILRKGVKARD